MTSTIERAAQRLEAARRGQAMSAVPTGPALAVAGATALRPPRVEPVVESVDPAEPAIIATPCVVEPVEVPPPVVGRVVALVPPVRRAGAESPARPPWWSGERATVPPWVSPAPVEPADDAADAPSPVPIAAHGAPASGSVTDPMADEVLAEPPATAVEAEDAFAREVMLRGERSARRSLDLPRMAAEGLLVPGAPLHAAADEFRAVKRGLLRAIANAAQQGARRPNLVLVTSAGAGEGKTWCALNLALGLAGEVDHSALVVDLAGGPQGLAARVGLPSTLGGVLDLLVQPNRLAVSDVMVATQIPKFSVLPLGAKTPHAAELLGSYAMDALLDDLARRYRDRVVILDAPGLLESPEVAPLAAQVGQVLVVVAQETASTDAVRQAFTMLADCPRVMSVFNRSASLSALHGRARPGVLRG